MLRYSIIVPAPYQNQNWPVLRALSASAPPKPFEVLVVVGKHPAIQRNTALAEATGEIIVFLDSDSTPDSQFWHVLETALEDPAVQIIGGPSLLLPGATGWEPLFQSLLANPLVVGPISARYQPARFTPDAKPRPATESSLILCNMAARRLVFREIGYFSPALFPNEENEWLQRAQARRLGIYYQPRLWVYRPQRKTLKQFFLTMIRYGIGRTHQFRALPTFSLPLLLPLFALVMLGCILYAVVRYPEARLPILELGIAGYLLVAGVQSIASTTQIPNHWTKTALATLLMGPLVPVFYTLGQFLGWFLPNSGDPKAPVILSKHR